MNAKFVFIFVLILYVNMCINVSPSPTIMRSEPFVKLVQMGKANILTSSVLCLCLGVIILSKIDLNTRYIPFNTRLNTLTTSKKANSHENLYFLSLLLLYLTIFEYFFIVLLPYEFCKVDLDIREITKISVVFVKMSHNLFANFTLGVCYRLMSP